jgi:hypothetical protein
MYFLEFEENIQLLQSLARLLLCSTSSCYNMHAQFVTTSKTPIICQLMCFNPISDNMGVSWIPVLFFTLVWGIVAGVLPFFIPRSPHKGVIQVRPAIFLYSSCHPL